MKWFLNRSTSAKLMSAFGLMAALMVVIGAVALDGMRTIGENTEEIYEKHLKGLHAVDEANIHLINGGRAGRMTVLAKTPEERAKYRALTDEEAQKFLDGLDKMDGYLVTEEAKRKLAEIKVAAPPWAEEMRAVARLAEAGRNNEAQDKLQATVAPGAYIVGKMNDLRDSKFRVSREAFDQATAAHRRARTTMLGVIAGGALLGLLMGYLIARLIARPLVRAVTVLESVAAADFSGRLDASSTDEVGRMAAALNAANEALGRAVGETVAVMEPTAAGDLTRRITTETRGAIRKMAEALNASLDQMAG
ncbi:MAG: MCP four helix bundle domain-containing protein, partial [Planctomycetes bacterium]|nr:MCP four helix bundle domain-containing protein [Planctomycetota bacterium]